MWNEVYWIPTFIFFWYSKFWNRNSNFSIFQQRNSKKNPTGIFGIKNETGILLPMGVPEIGTENRNSQPSLGWLQFKTMYLYASKTAPIRPFDMISSSKQVFCTLWTRLLHNQKSKNILFWPSYCKKPKLDNLLVGPSQKKIRKRHVIMIFFENVLDHYYSACKYLQLLCFRVIFWSNIFFYYYLDSP